MNAHHDALDFVLARLCSRYVAATAFMWLEGVNPLRSPCPLRLL
jgi:hypothetical protein